jgi:hypothetical protein
VSDKFCKERERLADAVAKAVEAVFAALDVNTLLLESARTAEHRAVDALKQHKKEHGCG